jgi:hypothetical protein
VTVYLSARVVSRLAHEKAYPQMTMMSADEGVICVHLRNLRIRRHWVEGQAFDLRIRARSISRPLCLVFGFLVAIIRDCAVAISLQPYKQSPFAEDEQGGRVPTVT